MYTKGSGNTISNRQQMPPWGTSETRDRVKIGKSKNSTGSKISEFTGRNARVVQSSAKERESTKE